MSSRSVTGFLAIGLAVATLAAYAGVLQNEFVNYDDDLYITQSRPVQEGLGADGLVWAFTSFQGANWFPLTRLSWMLDIELFGNSPRAFHVTNLLLHTANALLLFAFFVRATRDPAASAFVAAVFALHPLHVESVAWAAARKDVLSGFFGLLSLLCYLGYVRSTSHRAYVGTVVMLALALMAKPTAVVLPFLLLVLDAWPLQRLSSRSQGWERVREKLPLFALIAAGAAVTVVAQQSGGAVRSLESLALGPRVENALVSTVAYVGKVLWPRGLAVYYPHPQGSLPLWKALAAAAGLALVTFLVLRAGRRRPYLAVGWLWFGLGLAPVIGLVQVGQAAMADRYTYLPLVGLSVMAAWGARDLVGARRWVAGLAVVVCAGMAVATAAQVRKWRDSTSLFEHALRVTQNNHVAHINLGLVLTHEGRFEEAEAHLHEAIRIAPRSALAMGLLGDVLVRTDRPLVALRAYEQALRIHPDSARWLGGRGSAQLKVGNADAAIESYRQALARNPDSAPLHASLALALARRGDMAGAIASYRTSLSLNPDDADAHSQLALSLVEAGEPEGAVSHYDAAVALRPDDVSIHVARGQALQAAGRDGEAIESYEAALALHPRDVSLLNNIAWLLATNPGVATGGRARAVVLAAQAADLTDHRNADVLDTLSRAQASAGRERESRETARRALALAESQGDDDLAAELRARIEEEPGTEPVRFLLNVFLR
jgi:tetratricopeptide (TPR) repeat protein